jgi:hypothetical protein
LKMQIEILPELKQSMRVLTEEERKILEGNILRDGIREPLATWKYDERYILLDGRNRFEIATRHNLQYETVFIEGIKDLADAKRWVNKNQRGRRNITPEEASYYRGQEYLDTPSKQGQRTSGHSVQRSDVAKQLAEADGVTERTVRRDAVFAKSVNKLAETVGDQETVARAVLSKEARIKKSDVVALARAAEKKKTCARPSKAKSPSRKCSASRSHTARPRRSRSNRPKRSLLRNRLSQECGSLANS